ncbi:hypothetical protein [Mycobacterium sp. DBP42]|nr:hypothetical protein [Mycobacterium sp. DBP42]
MIINQCNLSWRWPEDAHTDAGVDNEEISTMTLMRVWSGERKVHQWSER